MTGADDPATIFRRESALFAVALAGLLLGFFRETLVGGMVLSPADVVFATASFDDGRSPDYEPRNRLLMDPVLQFEPWLEFTRHEVRAGRLPTWNPLVGCGAPHLANGQSAVFDPFHLVAYLGALPQAIAWMAALRLWVAGFGTFLLARSWGYSRAGRWLCGLSFPFCGFLAGWLLYPVASVAAWLPWLFLATDRALGGRRFGVASVAVAVGFTLLGGHVQTSAHALLAVGLYAVWRSCAGRVWPVRWTLGVILGVGLSAVEVVPLASYLARSPVWADRAADRMPLLAISTPRVLDAATTAFPYLFGSQRRGHPNLAKAVGVHNLNEAAGGFAGLAALIWLAPAAWSARRVRPRVRFLAALGIVGAMGAFEVFPVANLLRCLPVLNVADNRRLTLWVAFALVMLGGIGIDATATTIGSRRWTLWSRSWFAFALLFMIGAAAVVALGPQLRERSIAHYTKAAEEDPGSDPAAYRERAERQARLATTFLPRYYLFAAGHLSVLGLLAESLRRGRHPRAIRAALVAIILADLVAFGHGLNPAIPRRDARPESAVIAYLRREVPPPVRIVSVGAELPPNTLMRYGLADVRNYDSIELSRSVSFFDPIFEPEPDGRSARTSRRPITWAGIARGLDRLRLADVGAIVARTPPPKGLFARVDRVGSVFVARLDAHPTARERPSPREIQVDLSGEPGQVGWVAETFDPGWTAEVDGAAAEAIPHLDTFLAVRLPPGPHRVVFRHEPRGVRVGVVVSLLSLSSIAIAAAVEKRGIGLGRPFRARLESNPRTSARLLSPGSPSTEGRDADGPLHV